MGVSTQYIVETRRGTRVMVYEQNIERTTKAELWARGDEVHLTWSPDHTFVVEAIAERAGRRGRRRRRTGGMTRRRSILVDRDDA